MSVLSLFGDALSPVHVLQCTYSTSYYVWYMNTLCVSLYVQAHKNITKAHVHTKKLTVATIQLGRPGTMGTGHLISRGFRE